MGEAVLIPGAGSEAITLNPVGTIVWSALDGKRDVMELARYLLPAFSGASVDRLERDIGAFVAQLRDDGLVVD